MQLFKAESFAKRDNFSCNQRISHRDLFISIYDNPAWISPAEMHISWTVSYESSLFLMKRFSATPIPAISEGVKAALLKRVQSVSRVNGIALRTERTTVLIENKTSVVTPGNTITPGATSSNIIKSQRTFSVVKN